MKVEPHTNQTANLAIAGASGASTSAPGSTVLAMALKDHNMKNLLLPKPNSPNTMNTQHTPGPWKADHSGFGDAKVIAHNGWKNKAGSPFNPTIIERIDWPTARLIAAAPDLLAALIKCKEAVENGNLPPSARMELVRDYATPAITKAKGH